MKRDYKTILRLFFVFKKNQLKNYLITFLSDMIYVELKRLAENEINEDSNN